MTVRQKTTRRERNIGINTQKRNMRACYVDGKCARGSAFAFVNVSLFTGHISVSNINIDYLASVVVDWYVAVFEVLYIGPHTRPFKVE